MHPFRKISFSVGIAASLLFPMTTFAAPARADLRGKILLQVQSKGEAWYVSPKDGARSYLKGPNEAFDVMRKQGVGISNSNIWKIPIGYRTLTGLDTDGDGLTDAFEDAIGTDKSKPDSDGDGFSDKTEVQGQFNPYSAADKAKTGDAAFAVANSGRIFLQVESKGEAWWVNPNDHKRYYMGRPGDAFDLMRGFGLGITDTDLFKISVATGSGDTPAVPTTPTTPVSIGPTPVGSGYTLTGDEVYTVGSLGVIGQLPYVEYVDDVTFIKRFDLTEGETKYSKFERVSDGIYYMLECQYVGVGAKPQCKTERTSLADSTVGVVPSRSWKASADFTTLSWSKTQDRVVGSYTVPCYTAGTNTACFYHDLASMQVYSKTPTVTREAKSIAIGRPNPTVLAWPTEFDPWIDAGAVAAAASRDSQRVADIKQIQTALELYYANQNSYPVEATTIILGKKTGDIKTALCGGAGGSSAPGSFKASPCASNETSFFGLVPSSPLPADSADCQAITPAPAGTYNDYRYTAPSTSGAGASTYTLTFCISSEISGIPAGIHTATPAGIH